MAIIIAIACGTLAWHRTKIPKYCPFFRSDRISTDQDQSDILLTGVVVIENETERFPGNLVNDSESSVASFYLCVCVCVCVYCCYRYCLYSTISLIRPKDRLKLCL